MPSCAKATRPLPRNCGPCAKATSRKPHLTWLIDLIHIGLPDFQIPAQLLPVVTPARIAAPLLDL